VVFRVELPLDLEGDGAVLIEGTAREEAHQHEDQRRADQERRDEREQALDDVAAQGEKAPGWGNSSGGKAGWFSAAPPAGSIQRNWTRWEPRASPQKPLTQGLRSVDRV